MKQELMDFLEWVEINLDDIFDIIDNPEKVIERYLKSKEE